MFNIHLIGDIGINEPINNQSILNHLKEAEGKDLFITLNTIGGEVDEAFSIVQTLDQYRIQNKAKIHVNASGECASAGVLILLAGDTRTVEGNTMPFVHNALYNGVTGNAKELKELARDLGTIDLKIANYYSSRTFIGRDEALNYMGNDTSFTPEECDALGITTPTAIPQHAVVNKLITQNMVKDEKGLFQLLKDFFTSQPINKKEIATATGNTLVFEDLKVTDTIKEGDKATIDGDKPEGEVITFDGDVITFEDGQVISVVEKVEEVEEPQPEVEIENLDVPEEVVEVEKEDNDESELEKKIAELEAENDSLKAEIEALKKDAEELQKIKNKLSTATSAEAVVNTKHTQVDEEISASLAYLKRKLNK